MVSTSKLESWIEMLKNASESEQEEFECLFEAMKAKRSVKVLSEKEELEMTIKECEEAIHVSTHKLVEFVCKTLNKYKHVSDREIIQHRHNVVVIVDSYNEGTLYEYDHLHNWFATWLLSVGNKKYDYTVDRMYTNLIEMKTEHDKWVKYEKEQTGILERMLQDEKETEKKEKDKFLNYLLNDSVGLNV